MIYQNLNQLLETLRGKIEISDTEIKILDKEKIQKKLIDDFAYNVALNEKEEVKNFLEKIIKKIALSSNIIPSSTYNLYQARAKNLYQGITIPAINLRGLTYDCARALIRSAIKNQVGPFIFEIARSEIGYTKQSPKEYASIILSAAIKEGFSGPIFLQGDHIQVRSKKFLLNHQEELDNLKKLINQEVEAGFYNLDLDASTLVDLNKTDLYEQQRPNFETTVELTFYIRHLAPEGINISIGGEIGEIGKKNSTPEEFRAFMDGYLATLKRYDANLEGLSKISIQAGTSHGGIVLPDGRIKKITLDFNTLKNLGKISREIYKLGGVVQHGASTLPFEFFEKFPESETLEVHLATDFQNTIYEILPKDLKEKMYQWVYKNCSSGRKEEWTDEQFIYKFRKAAFAPFKKDLLDLPSEIKEKIGHVLEKKFDFLFEKLRVSKTTFLLPQLNLKFHSPDNNCR